jgi:hypothetical protein
MTTRETISKAVTAWMTEHFEKPTVDRIHEFMDKTRSLEALVEKLVFAERVSSAPPEFIRGLDLGELIDVLEKAHPDAAVVFDFGTIRPRGLHSYRGYYEDLAIGYADHEDFYEHGWIQPNAKLFRESLIGAVGGTYTGYKGGEYKMHRGSRVWVDNVGNCSGVAIVDVEVDEYSDGKGGRVFLRTWAIDR